MGQLASKFSKKDSFNLLSTFTHQDSHIQTRGG